MKCFYHKDADGKCAGYWVHKAVGGGPENFFPITYGEPFPFEAIDPGEQVWIVDYSISPMEMGKLMDITRDVIWIDHHKTAIERYDNWLKPPVRGLRMDGVAGCMLTYCYTTWMAKNDLDFEPWMIDQAPCFTKLIADYDVWAFKYGNNTRYFEVAFGSRDFSPCSAGWNKFGETSSLLGSFEAELMYEGQIMLCWRDQWAKSYMGLGFEMEWEGHHCFAVNLGRCNSDFFKSLFQGPNAQGYDILMPFVWNGKARSWTISLYSETVDCQEIAKRYGGGGHVGAAGFQCESLSWMGEEG